MKKSCFIILLICSTSLMMAQNRLKVGNNSTTISSTAVLEVESTTRGFLPPRMTSTQKNAISTPATGLQVYCTDCSPVGLYNYNGSVWLPIGSLVGGNLSSGNIIVGNTSGQAATVSMSGDVTINNTGATTITNAAVIGKVLTGFTSGSGTVGATDTVLQAIQKLNGNDALKAPIASPTFTGDAKAVTATAGDNDTSVATTAFVTAAAPDATTTVKGKIQLAGDLSGTAISPTIANSVVTTAKIADGTIANADLSTGTGGIYKSGGSLSGNTTVTIGAANDLMFSGSTGSVFIEGNNGTYNTPILSVTSNSISGTVATFSNSGTDANGIITLNQLTTGYNTYFHDYVTFNYGNSPIAPVGYIQGTGSGTTPSGIQFLTASDRRLKNTIHDTRYSLDDLLKINVRDYYFNSEDPTTASFSNGFIAQELYEVYPDAVSKGTDELDDKGFPKRIWTVDYAKLTPLLTKSIQDLNKKVENQSKQIDEMKAQIEELKIMILNK